MAKQTEASPILYYALQIADREFLLSIRSDGTSQWDDHSERRRLRQGTDRYLELWAFAGDARAFRRLQNECLEFTFDVPVTALILAKAIELAEKEGRPGPHISHSMLRDVAEMDDLLTDFFWKTVNPLLGRPINPELS